MKLGRLYETGEINSLVFISQGGKVEVSFETDNRLAHELLESHKDVNVEPTGRGVWASDWVSYNWPHRTAMVRIVAC